MTQPDTSMVGPLCKDCKHERGRDCHRVLKEPYTDVVSGTRKQPIYPYCSIEREPFGRCGPEARYFEPREKWWKRWRLK